MIIIAIHGPMGSGKGEVANFITHIAKARGKTVTTIPFAKPLKDYAKLLGWNGIKDKKGRRLLQLIGTECGRECIDYNLWVDKWKHMVGTTFEDIVICDDLRFMNEYTTVKSFNTEYRVIAIKLKGRGYQTSGFWKRIFWTLRNWLGLLHPSEKPMPDYMFDYVIKNTGTLIELGAKVENILDEVVK